MDDIRKRRVCTAIIMFSAIAILRSCNANLNKEKEPELKNENARIKEITIEDNYTVVDKTELDEKIQKILDEKEKETIEFTTQNKAK